MKVSGLKVFVKHKPTDRTIPFCETSITSKCYWLAVAMVGNMSWTGKVVPRRLLMVREKGICRYFLWTGKDKGEAVYFIRKLKKIKRLTKQQVEEVYGIQIR